MKKNYIILLLCFCTFNSYAQIKSYYYYQGEKSPLTINMNSISIIHSDDYESLKNTIERKGFQISFVDRQTLPNFKKNEDAAQKWSLVEIKNPITSKEVYDNLIENLIKENTISNVQPVIGKSNTPVTDVFYVKLKDKKDEELLKGLVSSQGCILQRENYPSNRWFEIKTTKETKNALELSNLFYETTIFEKVDPGFYFNFQQQCAEDSDFSAQWGLQNQTNPNIDINVCGAWDFNKGLSIRIGLFDDGLENYVTPPTPSYQIHSDLQNTIIADYYETQNYLSYNDRNNGLHGTGVLGIMAANHNQQDIAGVSPDAAYTLIVNKMNTGVNPATQSAELANGIAFARSKNLDILLNEFGVDEENDGNTYDIIFSESLDEEIIGALNEGMIIVFPAGNNRNINYPANIDPRIITVGAIDVNGNNNTAFASGEELDLVAPGINTLSLSYTGGNNPNPSGTTAVTGTSFAAPYVTSVVALILHENPCLTIEEISYFLESTAQKIGTVPYTNVAGRPNGTWNEDYGYGLVDAFEAIFKASNPVLLQNMEENGMKDYEKLGRIRAGSDIISGGMAGDYIINPTADITLKAWKSIHMENGTTIKAGSNFRAYIKEFSGDCAADDWYARTVPNNNNEVIGNDFDTKSYLSEDLKTEIELFPNPFQNDFSIKIQSTEINDYEIKVFDAIGKLVYTENGQLSIGKQQKNIPVIGKTGLYIVQLRIGKNTMTKKIMKHE